MTRLDQWVGLGVVLGCALAMQWAAAADRAVPAGAEPSTVHANRSALATLPMQDQRAFEDARRGLIEETPDQIISGPGGRTVWTLKGYEFLDQETAPDTVHPALWRHARLNRASGLYKVVDRVYQVRGFDISNMTVIEGDAGLIVIDPLVSVETARAALDLYFKHRPRRPISAVIYSHSHVDHFGGVRGVVSAEEVASGRVSIIAPAGFMVEAASENVIAGNAMSRRAAYQFGMKLPRDAQGGIDTGLGKPSLPGTVSLIPPTLTIDKPMQAHRIDGVDIVFELTPGAEAPAEMIMYYPQFRVLNMAEIVTQNFHNLLPMRGAQVRDALAWSKYIGSALVRYGALANVMIAQHNWPTWGSARVQEMLAHQRDAYRYLHDQTVRLMNQGYVANEIADMIELPESLRNDWSTHFFYGHLKHNVRAIYQRYLGYYDANPVNLEALPPTEAARKTVEYMGGADAVLRRAEEDFARGEFRWVAQIASQLVFADPENRAARQLAAAAYEQLGYQMESATARNAFLTGALELRTGTPKQGAFASGSPDVVRALTLEMVFDYLGVRLDAARANGKVIVLNWQVTDTGEKYVLNLENCALSYTEGSQSSLADATVIVTRAVLNQVLLQQTTLPAAIAAGTVKIKGRSEKVAELLGVLENGSPVFPIIEPRAR